MYIELTKRSLLCPRELDTVLFDHLLCVVDVTSNRINICLFFSCYAVDDMIVDDWEFWWGPSSLTRGTFHKVDYKDPQHVRHIQSGLECWLLHTYLAYS